MESWPFLIDYKNLPFDESTESIESQKFVGAFYYDDIFLSLSNEMQQSNGYWTFQMEYYNFHLTNRPNRSNRQKFIKPFYYGDIFISLTNEMQQSNGKLNFSNGI